MADPTALGALLSSQTFRRVWFRSTENKWRDWTLLAYREVGNLTVNDSSIEFQTPSRTLSISKIRTVHYGKQGWDTVNNWVKVEYEEGETLFTAFFADGRMGGWSGIFGGTKQILKAINHVPTS